MASLHHDLLEQTRGFPRSRRPRRGLVWRSLRRVDPLLLIAVAWAVAMVALLISILAVSR